MDRVFSFGRRENKSLVLRAHGADVNAVCLVGPKHIWTCSSDHKINVWHAKSQALVAAWDAHKEKILSMVYVEYVGPTKKIEATVWTSSADLTITMWQTKAPFSKIQDLQIKVPNPVTCMTISSEYVWGGSFEHMQIWTLLGGAGPVMAGSGATVLCSVKLRGWTALWSGGGVNEDDLTSNNNIVVWNAEKCSIAAKLAGHTERVLCLLETRDSMWSGSRDRRIIIWNKTTFEKETVLSEHTGAVTAMVWYKGEVWSTGEDLTLRAWSLDGRRLLKMQPVPSATILSLCVWGDEVWTGCTDGSVNILTHSHFNAKEDHEVGVIFSDNGEKYAGGVIGEGLMRKRQGYGEHHYADGSIFFGDFVADKRHGFGVMTSAAGDKYYGNWKNDMKEGAGMEIYADGSCYSGDWSEGLRFGYGEQIFPSGDKMCGEWRDMSIAKGTFVRGPPSYNRDSVLLTLWKDTATLALESVDPDAGPAPSPIFSQKWAHFVHTPPASEAVERLDAQMMAGTQHQRLDHLSRIFSDRRHPFGAVLFKFSHLFQAMYENSSTQKHRQHIHHQRLQHALHDVHSFTETFTQHVASSFGVESDSVVCVVHAVLMKNIFQNLFSLFKKKDKESDSVMESKLLGLQSIRLADVGAEMRGKLQKIQKQQWEKEEQRLRRRTVARGFEKGKVLKTILNGIDTEDDDAGSDGSSVERSDRSSVSAAPLDLLPSSNFHLHGRLHVPQCIGEESYGAAVAALRKLTTEYSCHDKIKCLHEVMGEIMKVWLDHGLSGSEMGADDIMPALLFVVVKARLPNVFSEIAFIQEFSKEIIMDENEYGVASKRLCDLESILTYIDKIDLQVRDENNILMPIATLCDRVVDAIAQGSLNYHRDSVGDLPTSFLWFAEIFHSLGLVTPSSEASFALLVCPTPTPTPKPLLRGPSLNFQKAVDGSKFSLALAVTYSEVLEIYFDLATAVFASVGLSLKRPSADTEEMWVLEYDRVYPQYVYNQIAHAIESFISCDSF